MKFPVRKAIAAGAVVAVALALVGCSSPAPSTGTSSGSSALGGTLTIGTVLEVSSFDPSQAHYAHHRQYFQPEYDSLLRMEADGKLVPMIATVWKYNTDFTELTLTIRKDVNFTDGTHLDASVVKGNLDRFRTGNGPDASTLASVNSVTVPDDATVVLKLSAPDPALLDNLAIASSFIASAKAHEGGNLATQPVGSGPYVMDSAASIPGSQYTFTRNKDYWDPSLQHYEKLVLRLIPDTTATLNALLSGQLSAGLLTSKTNDQALRSGLVDHLSEVNIAGIIILDRNGSVVPALGNVKVRQAMNYAIDRATMLKQVEAGLGSVTSQIFPESSPAFNKAYENYYPYDPAKARTLMAEAGFASGFDMEIPAVKADPAFESAVSQYLSAIGIKVTWNDRPSSEGISVVTSGKYVAAVKPNAQAPTWLMANQLLKPDAPYNPFRTTDPKLNAALKVVQTGTTAESAAAQQEINTIVTEGAWFVPFYRPAMVFVSNAKTEVEPQVGQAVPSIYNYKPAS